MSSNKKGWDVSQLRKYEYLNLEQIPRVDYKDPKVDEYIASSTPVVITNSNIVQPALEKWNLDYLEQNLGNNSQTVYISKNYKFKYVNESKIWSKNNPKGVPFVSPTRNVEMPISEFTKKIREWKEGDERLYLQQVLTSSKVGPAIVKDFLNFDWAYVNSKKVKHKWGPLTANLLLIAMEGNVTPCHYDEQENFFAQIQGFRRCILFCPDQFECFYPHPVYHPHDRQSMVNFDKPDYKKFPKFKNAKGVECVLEPGDVLYIPKFWWHHVESLMRGGPNIAVNFWYKAAQATLEHPLKGDLKVTIMRNVENMLLEVLGDPKEVDPLLRTMVLGRYTTEID